MMKLQTKTSNLTLKIQKLAKGLNKFTLNDILQIIPVGEDKLISSLLELEKNSIIKKISEMEYLYIKSNKLPPNNPSVDMSISDMCWLTMEEVCNLTGQKRETVRRKCKSNKYISEFEYKGKYKIYKILKSSIDKDLSKSQIKKTNQQYFKYPEFKRIESPDHNNFKTEEEQSLTSNPNGIYFYIDKILYKPKYPEFFECRTSEEINLLIKCFSVGLDSEKTSIITGLGLKIINTMFSYFRKTIYEKQHQELTVLFNQKPYTPRERTLLGHTVYFYYYNNKTYVSEKKLFSETEVRTLPRSEDREFRKDYLKLARKKFHNSIGNYICHHIAEFLICINLNNKYIPIELLNDMFLC